MNISRMESNIQLKVSAGDIMVALLQWFADRSTIVLITTSSFIVHQIVMMMIERRALS